MQPHVARERVELVVTHVGRVAHDHIPRAGGLRGGKQVALEKLDPLGDPMPRGILTSHGERGGRDVGRHEPGPWQMLGERDGDRAGAGAHVDDPRRRQRLAEIDHPHHQPFRLRPWHEHGGRDREGKRKELTVAHEIGHRLPIATPFHEFAKPGPLGVGHRRIERRVEEDPLAATHVRQQHFGVEPGRLAALRGEPVGGPGEEPPHRPDVVTHGDRPIQPSLPRASPSVPCRSSAAGG